ncbi:MAG: hypothetical protein AB2688_03725 [Candidatus Thiodiazotropha taylori]
MIIAVVTMGMMEPAIDDVIGVVAMGNSLMSTTWPVNMAILMIDRLAMVWVFLTHFQAVLIVVVTMSVVHMPIM